jgi:Ca-activated chloride channel homolog
VLAFGFRPGNPQVAVAAPIEVPNGVDPDQPQTLLAVPEPRVVSRLLEQWDTQRKGARVQLIIDVSGSMGEPAVAGGRETRLDLAKTAAAKALDLFSTNDEVGLRVFTSDIDGRGGDSLDLVAIGPIPQTREAMRTAIAGLVPIRGTPLYAGARRGYEEMQGAYRPDRINAVVLLTDGVNDDGDPANDAQQLDELLNRLRQGSEGENSRPVRLFTIAYGEDADIEVLRQMAEATSAAAYDAADPQSIDAVLTAVISNF